MPSSGEWLPTASVEVLLERWLQQWSEHDFGNCCAFEKETDEPVGSCGILRVATKIGLRRDPAFDDEGQDGLDLAFTSRPPQGLVLS